MGIFQRPITTQAERERLLGMMQVKFRLDRFEKFKNDNLRALGKISFGFLILYLLFFSYVIGGYSMGSGLLSFLCTVVWGLSANRESGSLNQIRVGAIAVGLILIWRPYRVEVTDYSWVQVEKTGQRKYGDLLRVNYYEPNAWRTRISIKHDEEKKLAFIEVWASYFPLDLFYGNRVDVIVPNQQVINYRFELADEYKTEGIRW